MFGGSLPPPVIEPAPATETSPAVEPTPPVLTVEQFAEISASMGAGQVRSSFFDGDKWAGSFGPTELLTADYWTLRARSSQLFESNLFARGLIRRLVTNEINTGLHLEASPIESVIGVPPDSLEDWSESVENLFELWGSNESKTADARELSTWGQLQQQIRAEALIAGDVLVVLQQDPITRLPRIRVFSGNKIQSPLLGNARPAKGNRIVQGVEMDPQDRHVAYWILQDDLTSKRLPAWGEKSGRRLAWLYYGTDKRVDEVRGKPLLSLVLQALRDLDRYRDAALRKAVINSIVAMFVEKKEKEVSGLPLTAGGAVKKGVVTDSSGSGTPRRWNSIEMVPGLILDGDSLGPGETLKPGTTQGTDERYSEFQDAVLAGIALAYEIPPEILTLKFASNYSASRAALNEFDAYVFRVRTGFGSSVCSPVYVDWLLASVLTGRVQAPGLLEAWRSVQEQHVFHAWSFADWNGHIKASVDPLKMMNGFEKALELGATTHDRVSRETSGQKFSRVVRKLEKENAALAKALTPLKELEARSKATATGATDGNSRKPENSSLTEGDDEEDREPDDDS